MPLEPGRVGGAILPFCFLDVDGVLNPFAMAEPPPEAFADFEAHAARGFLLRLSREMGRRLMALPAELCWATTWADTIDRDVAPFCGLPEGLRVAARAPLEEAALATNWKLVQIRRLVEAERRPFVWVDDDALSWPGPNGEDAGTWAGRLGLPHLLVAPDPAIGLTGAAIDQIARFLDDALTATPRA